jgi:hypothetical protein
LVGLLILATSLLCLADSAANKSFEHELRGVWVVTELVIDEEKIELLKDFGFFGDGFFMTFHDDHVSHLYETVGTGKKNEIDLVECRRPHEGRRYPAAYSLDGQKLTITFPYEEGQRPSEFASSKKRFLFRLERFSGTNEEQTSLASFANFLRKYHKIRDNLFRLNLAIRMYARKEGGLLPPSAVLDKGGNPLLSWRVLLLPYLGEQELFNEFGLDKAWDSEQNKKLIRKMPPVFSLGRSSGMLGETYFKVFVGPGTLFEPELEFSTHDINRTGRLTSIITIAEAREGVPWTKPVDIAYGPSRSFPQLGALAPDEGFHVALLDGSVRFVKAKFDRDVFRLALTINHKKEFDLKDLVDR